MSSEQSFSLNRIQVTDTDREQPAPQSESPPPSSRNSVFARIESARRQHEQLVELFDGHVNPVQVTVEGYSGPVEITVDGRRCITFGSNNYLGMSFDAECWQAADKAHETFGVGATTSRVASGTSSLHTKLEAQLSAYTGLDHAIVYSTGFMANLGAIAGLTDSRHLLLIDDQAHASIFDAARLSAAAKKKFRHNDASDLQRKIEAAAHDGQSILIITESLFSALGDEAPIEDIVDIKNRYGAHLLVDEAHSLGTYGPGGRGFCYSRGVLDEIDVITGTFSKSVGSIGGFVASSHPDFDYLRYLSRAYLFTAALPPSVVAGISESLRKVIDDDDGRTRLWRNARDVHARITGLGFEVAAAPSPIVTILFDDMAGGYSVWRTLFENGIYANALSPPATPSNVYALRFSVSAKHSRTHIDHLESALRKCRTG